ncbi:MAG: menaquinone biosynthesis protein [Acidobacteriota bacterium]|nr:menaquinone biosynthesis protein [Acidobacteriota bacterium]
METRITSPRTNLPGPRIAASSYLNSAPLLWSFTHGTRRGSVDLADAVPAKCAALLETAVAEAALVPIIEYQRIPNGSLVPNVCVGSREEVRSVVLVTRVDSLREVRSVALDDSSRTSVTLLKVIFSEFLGLKPEWRPRAPDLEQMLAENDGALVIGDPAMTFARDNLRVFDLASLWRAHTGLGFVFAMWMVRDDASPAARGIDFADACREGVGSIEAIVNFYEPALGLSRDELRTYLTKNISFSPDDEMLAGMELYFRLAHKHGLIPEVKPVKYVR